MVITMESLVLQPHLALQDAEKSNDLRKKLEARKALSAATTQVHRGAFVPSPLMHAHRAFCIAPLLGSKCHLPDSESVSPRARVGFAWCCGKLKLFEPLTPFLSPPPLRRRRML